MKKLLLLLLITHNCYSFSRPECLATESGFGCELFRYKIPHGWLVTTSQSFNAGITFVPDEKHEWQV